MVYHEAGEELRDAGSDSLIKDVIFGGLARDRVRAESRDDWIGDPVGEVGDCDD